MNALRSLFESNKKAAITSGVVIVVLLLLWAVGWLSFLCRGIFGVLIPYAALALFLGGIVYRVVQWAKSPEPFRIPTTCGQQKSLPWIKTNRLDCPETGWGVFGRMALEVLFFRSLFRNTKAELKSGPRLVYGSEKYLWLGALAFHWAFLIIVVRHLRFFTEPIPSFVQLLQSLDGFFQIGVPILYMTDLIILAALTYLFLRRVLDPKMRYISLPTDYFPLVLIIGIVLSGMLMRYTPVKADLVGVKELAVGLMSFHPRIPEGIGILFYLHLLMVCVLIAYFPFSKLMHMAGIFLSPTRNMANNNRKIRHVNPWNYPVKVHTYEEWEEEFKDKLKASGYTLEKE
ncbi:MAG: menaquinol oxidoreductase [Candidatus Omnitrophota bacterium]|jgi:nitrate reductase gamma subunit|nr:MAG: menaquinol oxidoreductase [Candidatus Omnitrophota bacterium]